MNYVQNNPDLTIIPMRAEHIPAVLKLERQCFSVPWSEAGLKEELLNPVAVFFVAQRCGQVYGYAGMHHVLDEGNITNIAVFEEHRRRGVGNALVFSLIEYAIQAGIARLTLEVRPSNEAAVRLYQSFGFCGVGSRRNFYTKPAEDALVMVKKF